MKIHFYIQSDKNPAPVYIRFTEGRMFDLRMKTGQVVNPEIWDADKWKPGRPKTNLRDADSKKQAAKLSKTLKGIDGDLTELYNETVNKTKITKEWLDQYFHPQNRPESAPLGLIAYFDYYREKKQYELTKPSLIKLSVVKHLLERMELDSGVKLMISDIDGDFLQSFVRYSKANGYAPNTVARNFRFIKTICYDAEVNGLEVSPKLKRLSLKNVKTDKIYLTPEDLALIEKAEFTLEALSNAKDWLIISCETGQRVSDFMRFKKEMIRIEAGKTLIEFTQKKTNKVMTIPLSKKVLAILKKNKGEFPRQISDQRYNEHIKKVCEYAGITYKIEGSLIDEETNRKVSGKFEKYKLVSSHIGRRSFATNNYGRIPTSLLIAATGHSTEKMFLEYIGKTDTQKALQLADYF